LQSMFSEIFQRQENEVKKCELKTRMKLGLELSCGGARISSYASGYSL